MFYDISFILQLVAAEKTHRVSSGDGSCINSLTPRRFEWNLRSAIFKLILMIGGWDFFCKIALRWMSLDLIDDKSTLVQVMAWCRQAAIHYLIQCWPRSMSPYGVTRPQSVNSLAHEISNFKLMTRAGLSIPCEIGLGRMTQDLTND